MIARLGAFVRLSRPLFLYGGLAGVALGAAVAAHGGHRIELAGYLWVQLMVTSAQLMVHYANDYFDRAGDTGVRRTAWSGGSGVLVGAELAPRVASIAALLSAACSLGAAVRFALAGDPAVAALGVAIVVLAWCYSAPPVRLAARSLGELDTVLVVAVLVPCAAYLAFAPGLDEHILSALVAPALAMFTMMLGVELPDAAGDARAAKRTLVVAWGPARTWQMIRVGALAGGLTAIGRAFELQGAAGVLALVPAAVAAGALIRRTGGDPRPATIAFWGVALFATLATGLAAVYALPPR